MVRALVGLTVAALMAPSSASAFFCRYPRQHLTGVVDLGGDQFVRLDLWLRLIGPECEVTLDGGRVQCRALSRYTLGMEFSATARGTCPADRGTIRNLSYVRRTGDPIADVRLELQFANGEQCTVAGVSPAPMLGGPIFGGPVSSLAGRIACSSATGVPIGDGDAEFLRNPLPRP
jgi:hypothetical protein